MTLKAVYDHIDDVFPEHLSKTQEFLRLRSISVERVGLLETAQWLKDYLETLGSHVQLVGNQEAPIVWAQFDLGRPKTLLVYGMYDVQPVANQIWSSHPFEANIQVLAEIGPCVIARGACNSKGPLLGFLNAVEALRQVDEIPLNLILTIEGEEEIGSPTLPEFYKQKKQQLKADAGFEPFWAEYGTDVDRPTLSLGSKGIIGLELICRGGEWGGPTKHAIHSSIGAWLASPTWRLIKALNTLVDKDEAIKVEGFYEEVIPPRQEDEELLAKLSTTFDENRILISMGAKRFKYTLHGVDLLRKYLYSPTMTISSLGQTEGDVIAPEARARLIIRVVPKMNPDRTIEKVRQHLAAQGYNDIEIRVLFRNPYSQTSLNEKVVQCMIETYQQFNTEPQIWPISASATPYYLFSEVLGIPYSWGGLGKAGRSHVSDEYFSVEGLKLFEKSIATFLHKFAQA